DQAPCLTPLQATSTRGVRARLRRVAGCATSTGFAGHAGTTANLKLTFHPDHSVGANQGPFWVSALTITCGQKSGIRWRGMNGAGHFIRFCASREETVDYLVRDKVLIVQGEPCKTDPFDCPLIGISASGAEPCGIALPRE